MQAFDVIIIGAGAAGLFCAICAAQRGRRVVVLERTKRPGKKILMSGGGRCNFTNYYIEPDCYISANPHFCISALSRYSQWDFINLVEQHQIPYHEKSAGQLFCDRSSKDILNMLLAECQQAGVTLLTQCEVSQIESGSGFQLVSNLGEFRAEALVIASGGLSIPTMGSTGFAYTMARQFAMRVLSTRAGLVPFTFTDVFKPLSESLTGISVAATVATQRRSFSDNILFTHRGLSGPAILQASSYWQEGEAVQIDLLPELDVTDYLQTAKQQQAKLLLHNLLAQQLPRKLVLELQNFWHLENTDKPVAELSDQFLNRLARQLSCWSLKPAGTEGYRTAEVTLGGVDTRDLSSKTMESQVQPGLFFIGEAVDVTGHLGGFNFQWAWSSAYVAGQYV